MNEPSETGRIDSKMNSQPWPSAPSIAILPRDSVQVWSVALDLPGNQVAQLHQLLSPDEQERAQKFRFARHRRRFVAARAALRFIVGRYLDEHPRSLIFQAGRYGKPFLAGNMLATGLQFNVTHSGDLALIAFTWERRVGVDLEQIRQVAEAESIAKGYFSSAEYAALMALGEGQRERAFLDCWTRKEAFIKAIGEGLSFPLDSFRVSLGSDVLAQLLFLNGVVEPARRWSMQAFEPDEDHVAALVYEGVPVGVNCYRFQFPAG
jgi:4'-phosphopantetheinyl transferase